MTNLRKMALETSYSHAPLTINNNFQKPSDIFGSNQFGRDTMKHYLTPHTYSVFYDCILNGTKIGPKSANEVASAMKSWAIGKGATHYTHWFQPLRATTAEKHDAFISPTDEGNVIEKFEGSHLIQQEPDASSFPSGGIRTTAEARGYTVWDPGSPAFIIGNTLCIPTLFISFTGEALDYKTPLLKALNLLDKAAVDVCRYFDKNVTKVVGTLGWEQEYFLVDRALYYARPDLVMTDRTLFGRLSPKGQQLENHYLASIPERVAAFMKDFEIEAWKLGIPVKTRHNEVAPNQYELCPVFEEINLSNDHNLLVMDLMERTAQKHNFKVLLHEKPYAGINGSGKHNNYSLSTNTGKNLLSPGKTPKSNLQFLTFFISIVKAVHDYANLLRASIATPGNEHRLGANEAPPAIISVFIGSQMTDILNEIQSSKSKVQKSTQHTYDIPRIPEIIFDTTDRNRSSPFAFTGNKFEYRALGSSANCSTSLIILNAIVANQLIEFKSEVDKLIAKGTKKEDAIIKVLKNYIISSKNILFEGDNYDKDWVKEAARRGLQNIKSAPKALCAFIAHKNIELLSKYNILSEREIHSRFHIDLENYFKIIQIESRILGELAMNVIIPAAVSYQNVLIENVRGILSLFNSMETDKLISGQLGMITEISEHINAIRDKVYAMISEREKANKIEDVYKHSIAYCEKVKPYFEEIRSHIDELEFIVEDDKWTLPKYREMLFIK